MVGEPRKPQRNLTLGMALIATALLAQISFCSPHPLLVWNASASIPIGLYWVEKSQPKIGEIAVLKPPSWAQLIADERKYLPSAAWLLKPVSASEGQVVCRFGRVIFVDGVPVVRAFSKDKSDRFMPVWKGCKVLKNGQLFLLSKRRDSFDSRYFGAVETTLVFGTAKPLILLGK